MKRGEKTALEMLDKETSSAVWPLMEIVAFKKDEPRTTDKHLRKAFSGMHKAVRHLPVYFLDTHEIEEVGPEGARAAFLAAQNLGHPFVPVTGVSRTADVQAALEARGNSGIAIRLSRAELEGGRVAATIQQFVAQHGLDPAAVHLIIDIGSVCDVLPEGVESMIHQFLKLVPIPERWATLALVGCAFPESMSIVDRFSMKQVERSDWKGWTGACCLGSHGVKRVPTYGDGGIQHPAGVEGYEPGVMPRSAAIRYALGDSWQLVKGESTESTPEADQYPVLAGKLLAAPGVFLGRDHCPACRVIAHAARGPGNGHRTATDWRRLGTAHHITLTVQQLRAAQSAT